MRNFVSYYILLQEFKGAFAPYDYMKATWFPTEVKLRKIRIHPTVWKNDPCLRIEILGCNDTGENYKQNMILVPLWRNGRA